MWPAIERPITANPTVNNPPVISRLWVVSQLATEPPVKVTPQNDLWICLPLTISQYFSGVFRSSSFICLRDIFFTVLTLCYFSGARCRVRTYAGLSQQFYRLPSLTTWVTWHVNEPSSRLELETSFLPRKRSTTELRRQGRLFYITWAFSGIRTPDLLFTKQAL